MGGDGSKGDPGTDSTPLPPVITQPAPPITPSVPRVSLEQLLTVGLSLFLGLFLTDAVISSLDDSLIVFLNIHGLSTLRGLIFSTATVFSAIVYVAIGLTPMVPKRYFLPLTLFNPIASLVVIFLSIYSFGQLHWVAWGISLCQLIFGLAVLYALRGGFDFHWPLVPTLRLKVQRFSWRNLVGFLLANIFIFLPALVIYLVVCAAVAVDHFSDGFMALRPQGIVVQAREYVRDGKTIHLYPMAHIGDAGFYHRLSKSFPTNALILMEGVSDNRGLLTNKISYQRAAESLGLAEQQTEFAPKGESVRADVDVEAFSQETIDLLNLVMQMHTKEVTPEIILNVMQFSPPPGYEQKLAKDLIEKRNQRLVQEIQSRLPAWEHIVVPWGAAHMPGIARELQKLGFTPQKTEDHVAIEFGSKNKPQPEGR